MNEEMATLDAKFIWDYVLLPNGANGCTRLNITHMNW
jgi:hypothetical protein